MKILYFCPFAAGGIVDYAHAQAHALAQAGTDITFLTASVAHPEGGSVNYVRSLEDEARPIRHSNRYLRQIVRSGSIIRNIGRLKKFIKEQDIDCVLFATYSEYAAPFWALELRNLARKGVRFSAVLHDPVRDYVVGPAPWHRWSIREGYSFLNDVFTHEEVDPKQIGIPEHIRLSVIPHGPYRFPEAIESGTALRRRLGIPADVKLLLSFGQIRDDKNLDLIIRTLGDFDNVWLLVAGRESGGRNQPVTEFQGLAERSGIAGRCRWVTNYIPPDQVSSYFAAADLLLLTYSRTFRSASGVLNAAVQFQKPCIASSGMGALRTQVQRYRLGVSIEPDDSYALATGLSQWLNGIPEPLWSEYQQENSWERNAEIVRARLFSPLCT